MFQAASPFDTPRLMFFLRSLAEQVRRLEKKAAFPGTGRARLISTAVAVESGTACVEDCGTRVRFRFRELNWLRKADEVEAVGLSSIILETAIVRLF